MAVRYCENRITNSLRRIFDPLAELADLGCLAVALARPYRLRYDI